MAERGNRWSRRALLAAIGGAGALGAATLATRLAVAHDTPGIPSPDHVDYDIVYGNGGGTDLKLDIYYSTAGFSPAPLVIFIHGGGFIGGDKRGFETSLQLPELLRRGFTVAALGYRLSEPFPAAVEDVKAGVRYLRANARRIDVIPERIGAWGESAGGNLAAMLGVMGPQDGLEGTGGNPGASSKVQAVADMYGPNDFSLATSFDGLDQYLPTGADRTKASPVAYVTPDDAAFILLHGEQDRIVPPVHSTTLHRKLIAAGVKSDLILVRNAGHAFVSAGEISPSEDDIVHLVGDFFDRNLKTPEQLAWTPP